MNFIAFEYHEKNFFHGDIKPDNIFYFGDFFYLTTDLGSLLYLGNPDEINSQFIATCYTESYASP